MKNKHSSPPRLRLLANLTRVLAWCLMMMIIVLTIVPPLLRPVTGTPHNVEHLAIFLVTGAAFGLGYPRREFILCALAILLSAMLEVAQLLIPGRHATFSDFLVDILSACAGIAAASLLGSARVQVSTR